MIFISGRQTAAVGSPVALLDVLRGGALVHAQDDVERLSGRGEGPLPLLLHPASLAVSLPPVDLRGGGAGGSSATYSFIETVYTDPARQFSHHDTRLLGFIMWAGCACVFRA